MHRITAFALACLVAAVGTAGQPTKPKPKPKPEKKAERLEVWAERVVYSGGKGTFMFTGEVTVLKNDLRVDCERMEGVVDAKTREITKVSALGRVRMVSVGEIKRGKGDERPKPGPVPEDAWRATCAKADYDLKAGRLVMTGKTKDERPRLRRGQGYGEADMIVFVPDDGYYELIGSPVIHGRMDTGPVQTKPKPADKKKEKG